jgi:hypothetical protein
VWTALVLFAVIELLWADTGQAQDADLAGTWNSNIPGFVYEVTRSGNRYQWRVPAINQIGYIEVRGRDLVSKWTDVTGSYEFPGRILAFDSLGKPALIRWDNKVVFYKSTLTYEHRCEVSFPTSGGLTVEVPPVPSRFELDPVSVSMSRSDCQIECPPGSAFEIPLGNVGEVTFNNEPYELPNASTHKLQVNFPTGGSITCMSVRPIPDKAYFVKLTIACLDGAIFNASMDPLP